MITRAHLYVVLGVAFWVLIGDLSADGLAYGQTIDQSIPASQQPRKRDVLQSTVGIFFRENGVPSICSGVLVSPRHVLTAGHCGCGDPDSYLVSSYLKMPLSDYASGKVDLETDLYTVPVVGRPILFDPMQCARGYLPGRDLAILRISYRLCDGVGQIGCADDFETPYWKLREKLRAGVRLTFLGYGRTERNTMGERRIADAPILTPDCVDGRYGQDCAPFREMILSDRTSGPRSKDSCRGDSGGPVFLFDQGIWRLVAITSRGAPGLLPGSGDCGGGGIYTLLGLNKIRNWLLSNIYPAELSKPDRSTKSSRNKSQTPESATGNQAVGPYGALGQEMRR